MKNLVLFSIILLSFISAYAQNGQQSLNIYKVTGLNGVKLREVPSPNGQMITTIPTDQEVMVLGQVNQEWFKVRYNGRIGFAPVAYFKKVEKAVETTKTPESTDNPGKEDKKSSKKKKNKDKEKHDTAASNKH
ncbi:MAG: SH3 domain-containing protein [Cytophagaceae bacterium]